MTPSCPHCHRSYCRVWQMSNYTSGCGDVPPPEVPNWANDGYINQGLREIENFANGLYDA